MAIGATLLGITILIEYLTGNSWIDQLFFHDSATSSPGRSSPHTAVAFGLLGLSLATLDLPARWSRIHGSATIGFAVVMLFALVGYIYGVKSLHGVTASTGIALHTLICLLVLGIGLTFLRPLRGLSGQLIGHDAGSRALRFFLPFVVLAPLALGASRYALQEAGLIGTQVGLAIFTSSMIIVLVAMLLRLAITLRRGDLRLRSMAAIVDASPDAVYSDDARTGISSWNKSAERLLGYTAEEAIGLDVEAIVPPDRRREQEIRQAELHEGKSFAGWETMRRRRDGTLVDVEISASPVADKLGRIVGGSSIVRDITQRKEAERRFQSLLDSAPDAMVIVDSQGSIVLVNQQVERVFGYPRGELLGEAVEVLIPDQVRGGHVAHRDQYVADPMVRSMGEGLDLAAKRKDGSEFPVEISLSPMRSENDQLVIAAVRDVTERRRIERSLAESEEQFRRSFEDSGIGMALVSVRNDQTGSFLEVNEALASITGYPDFQLRAMAPLTLVHPGDTPIIETDLKHLLEGSLDVVRREVRLVNSVGEPIWAGITASIVQGSVGEPGHLVLQVQDVSERKRFEGQLQFLADHDGLTGLFNRRRFEEELDREVATASRFGRDGAVLVLDLDHFKYVNDSEGHAAGDKLITTIGQALRRRLRATDVLGRMGGDEFAVILPQTTAEQAKEVGQGLLEAVRRNAQAASATDAERVTASIGIALMSGDSREQTGEALLAEADIAMYDAKEAGRDRLTFFDPGSPRHEHARARLDWLERIERALATDGFVIYGQPILPLREGERMHCELLLRMIGDDGDLIPPGAFLYLAERSDLAQRIDRWVVGRAIELLAEAERNGSDVCFEVNLSGRSMGDEELADFVAEALAREACDPGGLVFEVTETAAVTNVANAKQFAHRLRDIGCGFALDDFGAGFASFYYLKHLEFDYLKIDGEFIKDLATSRMDQLVVRSVVDIARGLGKKTIAECVGDQATIDLLRGFGVDFAQGFFIAMPVPIDKIDLRVLATEGSAP